ncbi:enoyl-CoA-hydratase DpgB [Umezawaea sp.]|uniref:enoyl-CoA-hydratase DpgB n=1 Tax=Umezawaea sp. TaxID=1955258 RepID=UPI002ED61785
MNGRETGRTTTVPEVRVSGSEPPGKGLTDELNAACAAVEGAGGSVPLVLRLGGAEPDPAEFASVGVHLVNKWEQALRRVERLGAVTVAVVEGPCTGTALELLVCCDHRIGSPETTFRAPVVESTPWPGMVLHRLVTQLGVARARGLVLFAPRIDAARAVELGLLDEVSEDVAAALVDVLVRCGDVAGSEVAVRRQLLLDATSTSFEEALGVHLAACDRTLRHERGQTPAEPFPQW